LVGESDRFLSAGLGQVNQTRDPVDPGADLEFWADVLPAAFRRENIIGSAIANAGTRPEAGIQQPDFDPFADIAGYEEFAYEFVEADTPEEVGRLKGRIDQERADLRTIELAGAQGVGAMLASGILDPITFIPVGGLLAKSFKSGKILESALKTGATTLAAMTASEVALHATQMDRTLTESGFNVTGAAFLGGVLGSALGVLGKRGAAQMAAALESGDPRIMGGIDLTDLKVSAEAVTEELEGVANVTGRTVREEAVKSALGLEHFPLINRMSPELQVLLRSRSAVSLAYLQQLTDSSLRLSKNILGRATGALDIIRTKGQQVDIDIPVGATGRGVILQADTSVRQIEAAEQGLQILRDTSHADLRAQNTIGKGTRFPEKIDAIRDANARLEALRESASDRVGGFSPGEQVEVRRVRRNGNEILVTGESGEGWIPRARLEQDPGHPVARTPVEGQTTAVEDLGEPLVVDGRARPSAAGIVEQTKSALGNAIYAQDQGFLAYRSRVAGGKAGIGTARMRRAQVNLSDMFRPKEGPLDFNRLTERQFRELAGQAARSNDELVVRQLQDLVPEAADVARAYRNLLFNPFLARAMNAGLLARGLSKDTAPSYFPRMWNTQKLIQESDSFLEITENWFVREYPEMLQGEPRRAAEQMLDVLTHAPAGRIPYEPVQIGVAGSLQPRSFTIPDNLIAQFLEDDIELVATHYWRTMSADIALAETFGGGHEGVAMTRVFADIRADYRKKLDLVRKSLGKEEQKKPVAALTRQRDRDITMLEAMRDRLRGTYLAPKDPDAFPTRALRGARAASLLALGGGFMISSIPDLARPIMVHGLNRTLRDGVIPMMRNYRTMKLALEENRRAAIGWEMVIDTRAAGMTDIGSEFAGRLTRGEAGLTSLARKMSVANLLSPWNTAVKHWSAFVTQARMLEAVEAITEAGPGKLNRKLSKELETLAFQRIDREAAAKIADQFKRFGEKRDGFFLANTDKWDDQATRELYRDAVRAEVDRIIVTPGIGDRPLWMSSELGKTIGQYKSFAMAATTRVLLSGLQQRDLAALNGLYLSAFLGMSVYATKTLQAGRDLSDSPQVWMREGVDRSGLLGIGGDIFNILDKVNLGPNRLTGGPLASRYQARNVTSSLGGPMLGMAETAVSLAAATGSGEFKQRHTRQARMLIPWQNLFWTRGLFDAAEQGLNESLGIRR
jgi:hypothetical protein